MPYKIRDRITGLFSTGGSRPRWTKQGKTWNTLAHVKSHLSGSVPKGTYAHSDIVTYRVVEEKAEPVDVLLRVVREDAAEKLRRRLAAENAAKVESDRRKAAQEIAELKKLQAKYPNV